MNSTDVIYPPGTFGPDGRVIKSPFYEYLVSQGVALTFVILFSVTTLIHVVQAIYFRMWWLLPTVALAGVGEILGWSGRLWSSYSPLLQNPFLIQIVATVLAPTPFVAALFMIFARVTKKLGTEYSRITPRLYSRIFLTADVISLVVQAVGGGLAATANTPDGSNLGAHIMLAGIIFQLVSLIIFIAISSEYFIRYVHDYPVRKREGQGRAEWGGRMKLFTAALVFIIICIFIRSIYRTAELADGWNGRIITTEVYFNVFDAAAVVLAIFTLNFFHPGYFLHVPNDGLLESHMIPLRDNYAKDASSFSTPTSSRV